MKILACQIRIPPMTDAGDKAAHVERVLAKPRREYPFRGDRRDDYRELPVLEAENGG